MKNVTPASVAPGPKSSEGMKQLKAASMKSASARVKNSSVVDSIEATLTFAAWS